MGLHDTFDFDEAAYRAKCAERPTLKLQEEEIRKLRQHFAASASMGIGLSHAVQTAGLTLGVSAFALRRYYVAKEKLAIIREELIKRGVPLHDMSKRDAFIPLGTAAVGLGVGAGISHLVGGAIAAPDVPVPGPHGGSLAMQYIQGDPEAAAHGFAQGITDQANAVGQAAHGAILGHGVEQVVTETGAEGVSGHAVGYAAGIMAAKKMEEMLAECIGETVFAYAMEKLLDPEIKIELKLKGKCTRLQGPLGQFCRGCGESIRHGKFARKAPPSLEFNRNLLTLWQIVAKRQMILISASNVAKEAPRVNARIKRCRQCKSLLPVMCLRPKKETREDGLRTWQSYDVFLARD